MNNSLTRLLALGLFIFAIQWVVDFLDSVQSSRGEEILAKYGYDKEPDKNRVPTFTEYAGGSGKLTPEEFNNARRLYLNDNLEKIVNQQVGKRPNLGITEWNDRRAKIESFLLSEFERQVPKREERGFTGRVTDSARALGAGVVGVGETLANIISDGPGSLGEYLGVVRNKLREGMTETEKIEAQRTASVQEAADAVGGLTSLWSRIKNIRATSAIETLAVPFILLELLFFRKIQRWYWPKKLAIQVPAWTQRRRKTTWVEVSKEQAKAHRLYGIKYGLLVLLAYMVLGPMAMWGSVNKELFEAQVSHSDFFAHSDAAPLVIAQMIIILLQSGVVIWAMLSKHPKFRHIATHAFAWYFPAVVVATFIFPPQPIGPVVAKLVIGLVQWVIFGGLWVWYLQRSQRVRVTFEHTLKTRGHIDTEPTAMPELQASVPAVADAVQTADADAQSVAIEVSAITPNLSVTEDEELLWSQALAELDGSDRQHGLWAQCYAAHNGHEPAARADYLKARVAQLRAAGQPASDQR